MLPLLPLPHLDRVFDYRVPAESDADAQPGVRVRIRFGGRLVDGYLLERVETSDREGTLAWLHKVVSPVQVLTPEIVDLIDTVSERFAGTRADLLRLAIPPRHARVENEAPVQSPPAPIVAPDLRNWSIYEHAMSYADAVRVGRPARAVWNAAPGEDWPRRVAEMAAMVAATGRGALIIVPDHKDLDRVVKVCETLVDPSLVCALAAGLGPAQRYRRWLSVLRGHSRIVVGTRSAAFAPVVNLGFVAVWDDGDDLLSEPRSPYPHTRDIAVHRAHRSGAGFLSGGFARTCEGQLLVESGWAHPLVASRSAIRERSPRVVALADSDFALERDPGAKAARIPGIAFSAARTALQRGDAVLVQVPRRGYVPAVVCQDCRESLRCRRCAGPLELVDDSGVYQCRWCSTSVHTPKCSACGSVRVRAQVVGARRTAEELGRAFPGVPVVTSGGDDVVAEIQPHSALVVCTPGAEPLVEGGYGAALLLDGWALLGRADLRAGEETLRKWMAAAALVKPASAGGAVAVIADAGIPVVQALVRWDPVGFAEHELAERAEVGFPPAVRIAAIDGSHAAVSGMLDVLELPGGAEVLGPVPLPPFARPPSADAGVDEGEIERVLIKVPRQVGLELSRALRVAQAARSARKETSAVRIQVDPLHIG
ncbi:primosomal protein N' [Hoyosella rhizosphaerae]|uniref:primosomal protein N' n=1 Tax=Hoyosella rhizosphaerae TaxID=1755582 RepID=UPI001E48B6CD|nr:primosomal protein N' [Hoyosella rhizosphaerae]